MDCLHFSVTPALHGAMQFLQKSHGGCDRWKNSRERKQKQKRRPIAKSPSLLKIAENAFSD